MLDISDALKLLIAEHNRLDRAIGALEGTAPRRGRPPGGGRKAAKKAPTEVEAKKRRPRSAAARKRHSERMKAYWAARRKAAKKPASTGIDAGPLGVETATR